MPTSFMTVIASGRTVLGFVRLTPAKDSYQAEYRAIHSSGQIVSLQQNGRAFSDSMGQMVRVIGITADITERKRAEAALQESEDRFRHVADAVPVSLWVTGPDGLVSFWNKSALRFTGRTMEQLVGNNWSDLIHPDDRVASRDAFRLRWPIAVNFGSSVGFCARMENTAGSCAPAFRTSHRTTSLWGLSAPPWTSRSSDRPTKRRSPDRNWRASEF